ncbi:MAG: DUF2461 domain-containing protein [Formosimonas sp.]
MSIIAPSSFQFLQALSENNHKEWFNAHKPRYLETSENFSNFVEALIAQMSIFDPSLIGVSAKECIFRIHKDTRFAKDKTPYKINLGASLTGKSSTGFVAGYYLHVQPNQSFLAGGYVMQTPEQLLAIRQAISEHPETFVEIVQSHDFAQTFAIEGEQLKKAPKGFDPEDVMLPYLKYKTMIFKHPIDDGILQSAQATAYCAHVFEKLMPLNAFLNRAVSNLNGYNRPDS